MTTKLPSEIVKRDGSIVRFDINKITRALEKAFEASKKQIDAKAIEDLSLRVVARIREKKQLSVEDVQDAAELVLSETGYSDVAKQYILYRKDRERIRNTKETLLDYKNLVDSYVNVEDWRVKENSTVTYSVGGLILSNSGAITANYWLSEIYDKEIAEAHRTAALHLHDLSMLTGYCAGWSLRQLITEGLGGVPGKITSSPPSHLSTLCNQMVNFLGIMQNEWAGAQAFSSFDTYLAPFVRVDNLSQKEVKQCIQSFVYGVNTPSRWGTQAPFSNITLDWTVPKDLADLPAIVGGKEMDFTYGECQKEMDMVNKAFIEIMIEGDANGRGFQYPIPSYSITRDFDWSETENNKLLFEMTAKYGTPYFSNYINSDMEPSDVRSMCPLATETKLLVRNINTKKIRIAPIGVIYQQYAQKGVEYEVWTGKGWAMAKPVDMPSTDLYAITLSNGAVVRMGENHLQPIMGGNTLKAKELQCGMWLPFNKQAFTSNLGDRELGFAIGAYAGDGSHDGKAIIYSLDSAEKDDETQYRLEAFWQKMGYETKTKTYNGKSVRFLRVNGNPYDIISRFLEGSNALEKHFLDSIYDQSEDFRRGVLEGFAYTDGARAVKRLYTSSKSLREDLCFLLSSLGHKYRATYEDNREGRYGSNPNYRVDYPERLNYKDLYKTDDTYNYYSITNIEVIPASEYSGNLYCLEVDNTDHLFCLANGLVTHNCRLRLDLRELRKKSGGFFGSGESTGSIGVVTINLPQIAYLATDEKDFYARLDKLMDIAARSLKIKREVITKLLNDGLYPYTKRYLGTFANHFSTIGLIGMNEVGLNAKWLRKDLTHPETQTFAKDVLNHMRERLSDYQEKYGDLYNLEATPAESTTYRMAKHDKKQFPDIITANENGTPYYTNSSHLPVGYTEDVFSALDIQDELQTLYTSGTVFHAFLGEKLPDWKAAATLVRKIAENYKLPYYTMSPTYSVCKNHGYLTGEQYICSECGEKTEVYSRITGYYRPVQNWNDGKAQEFSDRKVYDIGNSHLKHEVINTNEECRQTTEAEKVPSQQIQKAILFARATCPNCRVAEAMMTKANFTFEKLIAEENIDLVNQYGIKGAPTLIVIKESGFDKYYGVPEIKKFLTSQT